MWFPGLTSCTPHELGTQNGKYGICIPKNCESGCPSLGCLCDPHCLALQPGFCVEGQNVCNYTGGRPIAKCVPYDQQIRDKSSDTQLVPCNTNLECPEGLNYCHENHGATGGKSGFCAPRNCLYEPCPEIGDKGTVGSIYGVCGNGGKCKYNTKPIFKDTTGNNLMYFILNCWSLNSNFYFTITD